MRSLSIVVTGYRGSIGSRLSEILMAETAGTFLGLDIEFGQDITDPKWIRAIFDAQPDVIFHLAAAKSAPAGEIDPYDTAHTNILGTRNVLRAAAQSIRGNRVPAVVTASTCKACDPETAYGASKLVAERMTLQFSNGRVARFHNVVETQGNVFETWSKVPEDEALEVTNCSRHFICLDEAVSLLITAGSPLTDPGRYVFRPDEALPMMTVARRLYPDREKTLVQPRRGDRVTEPYMARCEEAEVLDWRLLRITSPYDKERP